MIMGKLYVCCGASREWPLKLRSRYQDRKIVWVVVRDSSPSDAKSKAN
jgi:hypothetical protein